MSRPATVEDVESIAEGIANGIAIVIRDDILPKINERFQGLSVEIAALRSRIEMLEGKEGKR